MTDISTSASPISSPSPLIAPAGPTGSGVPAGRRRGRGQPSEPVPELGAQAEPAVPAVAAKAARKEKAAAEAAEAVTQGQRAARFEGLSEEAHGVLELFATQLAQISFPEVDAAVLEQRAEEVVAERRAVEAARAALESATAELQRKTEELTALSRRGLAYARIYASAHPEREELATALARLDLRERGPKAAPRREEGTPAPRRGRPPKSPRPELPFAVEAGSHGGDADASEAPPPAPSREPVLERDEQADAEE